MSASKCELVSLLIKKQVKQMLSEMAMDKSAITDLVREHRHVIAAQVAYDLVYDDYRWLELCDLMGWRRTSARR